MNIEVFGERIIIAPVEQAKATASGIILPENYEKEPPQIGKVLVVGSEFPYPVKVGDQVLYAKYSGSALRYKGKDYIILDKSNTIGLVRD